MLRLVQRGLLVAGLMLLGTYGFALIQRTVFSRAALASFDEALAAEPVASSDDEPVDFSLWATARIRKYRESLHVETRPALAVLSIERLRLRAPVFEGTDELVLNRGVGRIIGTAEPGADGNIGIAGHRDGIFRGLKDVVVGDVVELTTLNEKATYVVDGIEIVAPENVGVLQPRDAPSLTLVTCFPFYFIGDAPERYIVHASLQQSIPANQFQTRRGQ